MSIYVIVFLAAVLLSVMTSVIWFRRRNIIESAVIGIIWFFCSHVLVSFGLFLIDWYSLFRTICLTCLMDAAVLGAAVFVRRPKPFSVKGLFQCDLSLKPVLIPLLICLLALPFTLQKNEFFGMGQDQGVYQTQAILFLHEDTARQKEFEEYHLLETAEEQEHFYQSVTRKLGGYDIPDETYPDTVYDRTVSAVSGLIHGIPTHAAILAMWGELFGIEHMADVETVFYLCLIFLVFCICRNLKLKRLSCAVASLCTAFAPIVIWVSKASLTEMFLCLLPALFLYFLTDRENLKTRWISILPVAVFGCFHVSFYTMIPLFLLVYGGMYFFSRSRQFAILMPATVVLYVLSYFSMRHIQPVYTMNNYSPIFVGGIGVHNVTAVVIAVSFFALLVSIVYVWLVSRTNTRFYAMPNWCRRASHSRSFRIFLMILLVLPVLYIGIKALLKYNSLGQFNNLALLGFFANAGILLIPLALAIALFRMRFIARKKERLTVFLMFFYCILIYSAFLRYEIQYYFYYARYLAPFISIAAIFAAMVLDRLKKRWVVSAALLGLCYVTPYNLNLMYSKDDTRMEWEVLLDVSDAAKNADCIVIDRDYLQYFWLSLDAMTEADIYPEADDPDAQLTQLCLDYGSVLYLTEQEASEENFTILYRDVSHHSEDNLLSTGKLVPMSYRFWKTTDAVNLYCYDKYRLAYHVSESFAAFEGLSVLEHHYAWTAQEETKLTCRLYPADYTLNLSLGNMVPLTLLDDGCMEIAVYLNGKAVGEIAVTEENNGGSAVLTVPEEMITDGENQLTFESELWAASEITEGDMRMLGFPLESVEFVPAVQ